MGLDLVEIVIQTEEAFGITIEDSDAEQVRTVGNLYTLVCKLRNLTPTPAPTSSPSPTTPPEFSAPISTPKSPKISGSN